MQLQNGYSAIFDKIHRSEVRAITHSFHAEMIKPLSRRYSITIT